MIENQDEMLTLLREIHDLLIPISESFKERFISLKGNKLMDLLSTELKKRIFSLIVDPRNLSQIEIAKQAGTSQPSVSRLVTSLLEEELIEKRIDPSGKVYFVDRYVLLKRLEEKNERPDE